MKETLLAHLRPVAAFGLVLALGGCVTMASPGEPPTGIDLCRASDYQSLIGTRRADLPPAPAGAVWRVACDRCPVTMDFNPRRLNILFDQDTGIIESVSCG